MSVVQTTFFRGAASTSSADLYAPGSATNIVVTNIIVTNSESSAQNVTISFPNTAGTLDVPVISNTLINANDTISFDMKQPVAASSTAKIKGTATSTGVSIHIAGVVIT
jgi:hypothetical protein